MQVDVRLYATLRQYAPSAPAGILALDVKEGSTAADVISELQVNANEVQVVMINSVVSTPDQVLVEGDRLALFPPVGGG